MNDAVPAERILDPRRILHVLQQLQARRATLAARPQPAPVAASTVILGADASGVVLDALFPAAAQRIVRPGTPLEFSARLDGVAVEGALRVRAVEPRGDGDLIRAELPRELRWSQRRAAYRVPVHGLPVAQLRYDGRHFRAQVLDLSVLGLGASVATEDPFAPGRDSVWELRLPEAPLVTGLRICSAVRGGGSVRLGGRYLELSRAQRQALQKAVTDFQRTALRRR